MRQLDLTHEFQDDYSEGIGEVVKIVSNSFDLASFTTIGDVLRGDSLWRINNIMMDDESMT